MPLKYNPLLKIGLENTGNGSGDNSKKVSKFYYATDTLEDGEIAQYQGVNDVDNNLINGFFYKVDVSPVTIIPAGTPYFYFTKPFESDVFNIIAKDRYYLIESNVFTLNNNFAWSPDNPDFFYPYQYIKPATIGNPVYCQALKQYKFITAINGDSIVCDDISFIYGGHLGGPFTFSKYINQDGQVIFVSPSAYAVIYEHNNLQYGFARSVLSPTPSIQQGTTNQQITLGGYKFTRVDTQPNNSYTLPVATPNVLGGVKVGNNLSIDANGVLSASGSSFTLPTAAANVLGGVKVGSGLSIDANGVLSASGGGGIVLTSDVQSVNANLDLSSYSVYYVNGLMFLSCYFDVSSSISRGASLFEPYFDTDYDDVYSISCLISDFPLLISSTGDVSFMNVAIWQDECTFMAQAAIAPGSYAVCCVLPVSLTLQS